MNTIDNAPDRDRAERTAASESPDNGTSPKQGSRPDTYASFTGTRHAGTAKDLFDDAGVAAEVRNEPDKPIVGDNKYPGSVGAQKVRQPSADDRQTEPENGDARNPETDDDSGSKMVMPKSLVKRYLIAENKFYFRDDPNLLAFEDKGKRLSTEHNDPQVAQSMVELAQAKNWNSIKVKGSDEFKREVWLAASMRGLDVQGYAPSAIDKERLAELRAEFQVRHQNSIEHGLNRQQARTPAATARAAESDRPPGTGKTDDIDDAYRNLTKQQRVAVDALRAILTERGDSVQAVEMAANLASERFQQQRVYVGRLLTHGHAPYEHKPDEKMNYFVTLKTPGGDHTIWGVDLERAVAAANAKPGEDLALVSRGKKPVTVLAHERDDAGKLTGKQVDTVVNRNSWEIGKLDKMREEAQGRVRAAAEQTARNQPEVRVYDVPTHPQRIVTAPSKTRGREQSPSR